jgi:M6 family metalloprotease-like protein
MSPYGRRSMLRSVRLVAVAGLAAVRPAAGQDIEAVARARGLELPAAYWRQIALDSASYEFERALQNRAAPELTASEGVVTLPVVLALFADSPLPHVSRDAVDASLFVGPAERGTVTDAYLEMSRGVLEVRGDVFEWVRTGFTLAQVVGDGDGLGTDNMAGEYFEDAVALLDPSVDFSQYDNDGPDGLPNSGDDDGYVDVVTIEYLEVAASCGGPAIWPHRWTLTAQNGAPFVTDDPSAQDSVPTVRVSDYITQSVTDCSGETVQDASTIAHEFGHALGLPDYYHPTVSGVGAQGRRWVMGCWALMAGGAWGCGPIGDDRGTFGPTHMMAHSKGVLGWIDYVDPGEVWNEEIFLDPIQSSGLALRIPMGDAGTEFLIAEYRTRTGFDAELPADGLVMYKLDETAQRRPDPASGDPYFLTLLEQDGDEALLRNHFEGGDRGVSGDAWGVGGVSGKLTAETVPALRLSDGRRTPVVVHEVAVQDGRARLVLSTGRTPRLIPPGEPLTVTKVRTFVESVRIAGGTGPYTPTGTVPDGVVLSSAGDELLLVGSLLEEGPYELSVSVLDALGNSSDAVTVSISAPEDWMVSPARLLQRFLHTDQEPLDPGELQYLDTVGNANGRYDVGDLRRWLREGGGDAR